MAGTGVWNISSPPMHESRRFTRYSDQLAFMQISCTYSHTQFVIESSCNGMFGIPWNGDTIEHPDASHVQSLFDQRSPLATVDEPLLFVGIC